MSRDLPNIDGEGPKPKAAKKSDLPQVIEGHIGYVPRNVDVKMTRAQARILQDKLRALQDSGAQTADGRFVANRAQAVRWIIENEVVL
jgi:hypothetical protein